MGVLIYLFSLKINIMLQTLMSLCGCPPLTAIKSIPVVDCRDQLKQVQRVFPVRANQIFADNNDDNNNIPASTVTFEIDTEAYWNVLFAATDSSKVLTPPLFSGDITLTPGTPVTIGGDNSQLNGQTRKTDNLPTDFSARWDNLDKEQIHALRKLECEGALGVFLVTSDGKIVVWEQRDANGDLTDVYTSIPVYVWNMGPKGNQGWGTDDANVLTFQLPANYDEHLTFITPSDFEALNITA